MLLEKKGVIAGISSVAGERGRQSNYIYGSAKAGFTAYLSGLRNRMFPENVHVVSVQPGFVYTRMTQKNLPLPPLLTAQPEQVANTVYKAVASKKNVVYVKWFWRWIMLIIRSYSGIHVQKTEIVSQPIAFFDFDGTITTKDTLLEIFKYRQWKGQVLPRLPAQ